MNAIPGLIQKYISAQNDHNVEQRLLCFAPDSTVLDEGESLEGTDSIRQWMLKTEAKYAQKMKALACKEYNGEIILTAETSGTFAGSPINLDYHFTIKNDRIFHLEVKVTPKAGAS